MKNKTKATVNFYTEKVVIDGRFIETVRMTDKEGIDWQMAVPEIDAKKWSPIIVKAVSNLDTLVEALEYAQEQFRLVSEKHNIELDVIPIEDAIKKAKGKQ